MEEENAWCLPGMHSKPKTASVNLAPPLFLTIIRIPFVYMYDVVLIDRNWNVGTARVLCHSFSLRLFVLVFSIFLSILKGCLFKCVLQFFPFLLLN